MITTQLLRPESIVVVGASNNVHKPGGAILKNLINGGYRGRTSGGESEGKGSTGSSAFADVNDHRTQIWRCWLCLPRCVLIWWKHY